MRELRVNAVCGSMGVQASGAGWAEGASVDRRPGLRPFGRRGQPGVGITARSRQTRGGSESFRDFTPAREEMGLKMDLKPPRWCLVQFPKMAAHLLGKITAKNIWFGAQAQDRGDRGVESSLRSGLGAWRAAGQRPERGCTGGCWCFSLLFGRRCCVC